MAEQWEEEQYLEAIVEKKKKNGRKLLKVGCLAKST